MDKHLDITKCLHAFAHILQTGEKSERGYFFEGLWAQSLDDGYTVRIFDNHCELVVYFHNKHQLKSPDSNTMEKFVRKIYRVSEL